MMLWKRILLKNLVKRVGKSNSRGKKDDVQNFMAESLVIGCKVEGFPRMPKRKLGNVESNKDKVKKQKTRENNEINEGKDAVDRISDLPDHIVHHIFGLLHCPKDVARTNILSKRWKSIFDSFLTFDFDERYFRVHRGRGKHNRIKAREVQKKNFKNCIEKSLAARLEPKSCIHKFRLYVNNLNDKLASCMDRWLSAAVDKNVKELEIHVNVKKKQYLLPDVVLMSETITSLKLSGCLSLFGFTDAKLCNLRELSMKKTLVTETIIRKVEHSCPLIEDLRVIHCRGPVCLRITALVKLRRVEVHECDMLSSVEIEASNLETFWYHGQNNQPCKFNLTGCQNLKHLTLNAGEMTDEMFQNCISKFPLLEKLFLKECNSLDKITIISGKLKSLALMQCMMLQEANINTPSLFSFEYSGHKMSFPSMNISGLREAKFHFNPSSKASYISELQKFFGNFDQFKDFKLIMHSKQNMTIFEDPREVRLVRYIDEKLELTTSKSSVLRSVDSWLQALHRKRLTVVSSSIEFPKSIHTLIMNREDDSYCCRYYSRKCWRHYLAGVKMAETLNNSDKTTYDFKWRSTPVSC